MLLQGIAHTAEQRQQMIKRMEPLAEENEKLKEAMKLMEKNVQRDLEYQKGVLSEQLATMSEQLRGKSEQLEHSSEQVTSLSA